jgi:hypothetical protein
MPWLFAPFAVAAIAYLAAVGYLAAFQRRMLYRPAPDAADPAEAGVPWMTAIHQDGRLLGWYAAAPDENAPVLVFFHGNQGTVGRVANKMAPWRDWRLGLLAATYRGYAGNSGDPSEAGLYEDARAALAWLAAQGVSAERLILYGESLGTGIAAQMAIEQSVRAVVLEAPYVNIPELAAHHYPWTPARLLVQDRFDTLSKIGQIGAPVLILHGSADRTIPVGHARRLLAAASPLARLVEIPDAGHVDLFERGADVALRDFIRGGAIRGAEIRG